MTVTEKPKRIVRVEHVMGTAVSVDCRDLDLPPAAFDKFFAWLHEVDERFSTYKESSEISRIRRGDLTVDDAHQDVRDVLVMCDEVRAISGDAFDAWRQRGGLDPSALVKGWSLEVGAGMLEAAGARRYCINGGGDVIVYGEPAPGEPWRVGIRNPFDATTVAAVVESTGISVATSGTYERGEHIIDPRTGTPVTGLASLSVAGPSLTYADAYSTAAFAMGEDGIAWAAKRPGYGVFAVTADRRVVRSETFPAG